MSSITELRKYRYKKIALFDLISAFIIMLIIFYLCYAYGANTQSLSLTVFLLWAIILTIPVGILTHVLFGVKTQLNYRLGLSEEPN
jgi:membrane protein DedA with SNARE-associated domain